MIYLESCFHISERGRLCQGVSSYCMRGICVETFGAGREDYLPEGDEGDLGEGRPMEARTWSSMRLAAVAY